MSILKCENLCVSYDGNAVIQNASFSIDEGDYVLIVGENGSGKSTLIKTILGLIQPVSGTLSFENGFCQNEIGYLAQQSELKREFPAAVSEVVLSGFCGKKSLFPFYTKVQKKTAHEILKKLRMEEFEKHPVSELSGGQLQRVLLARALCATEKIILCDEPVSGLDASSSAQLYSLIKQLNDEKITVIMVTHDLHRALPYANKVIHMGQDEIFCMSADEYKKSKLANILFKGTDR